jgi:hypothetical protein
VKECSNFNWEMGAIATELWQRGQLGEWTNGRTPINAGRQLEWVQWAKGRSPTQMKMARDYYYNKALSWERRTTTTPRDCREDS